MTAAPHGSRPVALVTGAAGQLGATIARTLAARWSIVALTRGELDLLDRRAVEARVRELRPDVVVNCAAYTDVDGAETAAEHALRVNGLATRTLARAAAAVGAAFVHYSTDFVFDGTRNEPYRETDPPEPKSVYAQSKLVGEWMAADAPVHFVLRVESLFGGEPAKSSIDRIIAALSEGREARAFSDRTVSPSYVDDVVDATVALVERGAPPGLYHCVNTGCTTWYEVARFIAGRLGRPETLITPVSVRDVVLKARRPQYAALSNEKLVRAGIPMPTWQDAMERYLARVRA